MVWLQNTALMLLSRFIVRSSAWTSRLSGTVTKMFQLPLTEPIPAKASSAFVTYGFLCVPCLKRCLFSDDFTFKDLA